MRGLSNERTPSLWGTDCPVALLKGSCFVFIASNLCCQAIFGRYSNIRKGVICVTIATSLCKLDTNDASGRIEELSHASGIHVVCACGHNIITIELIDVSSIIALDGVVAVVPL